MQIEILIGPDAGQRRTVGDVPLGFGRAEDNAVVIDLPFISRHHAQVRRTSDGWHIVNHSPNGTRIGKRIIKNHSETFSTVEEICVGQTPVLRVLPADKTDPTADPVPSPRITGRTKLWTGIGIYLLIMLAMFLFFATLKHEKTDPNAGLITLTNAQIRSQIRTPIADRIPDPARAQQSLDQATAMFHAIGSEPDALYHAYRAYRLAQAFSPDHRLAKPLDVGRYQSVRDWLIKKLTNQYNLAMTYDHDGHFKKAANTFANLARMYPDYDSMLFRNIQAHLDAARQSAQRN